MSVSIGKPAPTLSKPTDGGSPLAFENLKGHVEAVLEAARSL